MSIRTAFGASSSQHSLAAGWAWLRDHLRRYAVRLRRERRARRAIGEMMALDDRMLSDIGLNRGSIGFAAHHGHLPPEQAPLGLRSLIAMPEARREEDRF